MYASNFALLLRKCELFPWLDIYTKDDCSTNFLYLFQHIPIYLKKKVLFSLSLCFNDLVKRIIHFL